MQYLTDKLIKHIIELGKLIPGSPADRCEDLKVDDRIIAVNRIDINGMSHGDVVNLIKESGLHVRLTIGNPKETMMVVPAPPQPSISLQQQHHQQQQQQMQHLHNLQQQQQLLQTNGGHLKNDQYYDNYSMAHPQL